MDEPIHTAFSFHTLKPIAQEMVDETNQCIRRIVSCALFFDEALIDPGLVIDYLIGRECEMALYPDEEEARLYRFDDIVFTGRHRARLHLSRPLKTA